MCQPRSWLKLVCMVMVAAFCATPWEMAYPEKQGAGSIQEFLAVGKPGEKPIDVRAWFDKEPGQAFQTGDRVIMSFQTDRAGHVMVLHVAPDRSVQILWPDSEHADGAVREGTVYTLFGDDSRIRLALGKKVENAQLVICASSKPFGLDPLNTQGGQLDAVLKSAAELRALRTKLQAAAEAPGFNVVVLPFHEGEKYGFEPELTVAPQPGPPARRGLPGAVESDRPGTVTGVQGVQPKKEPK